MIKIYKKCDKSINNPLGAIKINDFSNYDKPFLFCISPQEAINKSVFGTIKEGARAARVRTTDEFAAGYKISRMPVDFLGIKTDFKDSNNNFDLVNDFLYPFLKKGNDIKKQARKMNFFTYCNATNNYVQIENKLKEKLLNDGYSENEVNEILSQISLISIASEIDISKINATAILFKDVNDMDVHDSISRIAIKKMTNLNRDTYTGYLRSNGPLVFAFNGSGEHNLKAYFKDGSLVKSSLCAVTSFLLDNSIKNTSNSELVPISPRMILQMTLKYNAEFEDSNSLLTKLSEEITYNGAPKYSEEEELLLKELDIAYLKLAKTEMMLAREMAELEKVKKDKQILISEVKNKSSDVAFHQIVVNNGMWNNSDDKIDYNNIKTDREIREKYEKMFEEKAKIR